MTDAEIRTALPICRRKAFAVGTLSWIWETIFDAEEMLAGKPTIATRAQIEAALQEALNAPDRPF